MTAETTTPEATAPTMLFVGGARDMSVSVDMASDALTQAAARGIRTHIVNHADVLAATPEVHALAEAVSVVDFTDPEATVEWAVGRVAGGGRFDAVYAIQEMAQVTTAEVAEALGAPGNPPAAIRRVRTKDACRAALTAAGFLPQAVFVCADAEEAEAVLLAVAGPWIVKPRDAMGSIGVSQVFGPEDLPAALAALPDAKPFLVEQFVEGPEFSVEGVFLGGVPEVLAITAKETVPPPYFVEVGHVLQAELDEADRDEIVRQVGAALTTLELKTGAFHVELWLTSSGVVLGEVHGRFGGDWIHRMLTYSIPGVELFGLIYDDMLGRAADRDRLKPTRGAPSATSPRRRAVSWRSTVGRTCSHTPPCFAPSWRSRPETSSGRCRKSSDQVGFLVVGADSPEQAGKLALELSSSVRFAVELDAPDVSAAP